MSFDDLKTQAKSTQPQIQTLRLSRRALEQARQQGRSGAALQVKGSLAGVYSPAKLSVQAEGLAGELRRAGGTINWTAQKRSDSKDLFKSLWNLLEEELQRDPDLLVAEISATIEEVPEDK